MTWFSEAVYVHVGLHKTATSWLQDHYFTQDDHFWIPSVESTQKRPIKEIGHWIIGNKNNTYWMYDEFKLSYYKSKLSDISKPPNLLPIISNERLSGHPFSGGFDRKSIATRIKSLFPKARIIVTIRDQNSLIFSEYMQYLRKGGWQSPELFLRPPTDDRQPCLLLSFWDYHQIYLLYSSMFGAENVLFLPQEILRNNPDDFFAMISKFCAFNQSQSFNTAEESNPRRPILPSYLLRKIGHLQKKSSENAFRPSILPKNIEPACYWTLFYMIRSLSGNNMESYLEKKLKNRINDVIGDAFVSSNRRFASDSGLKLSDLGYAI